MLKRLNVKSVKYPLRDHVSGGHVSSITYSVVDDIRNQFIIRTKEVVIFVVRKLILNFSIRFLIFKKTNWYEFNYRST